MKTSGKNRQEQVIVVGAGASGMVAAIIAAYGGANVRVLEQMKKPGRKLLLTGNGKCNMTNLDGELAKAYHSVSASDSGEKLVRNVLSEFDGSRTLRFFEELGLMTMDKEGCVYPRSGQSQAVLNALLMELERLHVLLKYDTPVTGLRRDAKEEKWMVLTPGWTYRADAVILCCGSEASHLYDPAKSSFTSGCMLAGTLGHTIIPFKPALTAMRCMDPDLPLAAGSRTLARVKLMKTGVIPYLEEQRECRQETERKNKNRSDGHAGAFLLPKTGVEGCLADPGEFLVSQEEGELQWTAAELSGIPVFQLSRFAYGISRENPMVLAVDFVPSLTEEAVFARLMQLCERYQGQILMPRLLENFVPDRIGTYLLRKSGWTKQSRAGHEVQAAATFAALLKRLALITTGTRSKEQAQICIGGVSLRELDPGTLESVLCPGLFLAGEMLDVDGPCGGYNLQWAWSSGARAGKSAADYVSRCREKTVDQEEVCADGK